MHVLKGTTNIDGIFQRIFLLERTVGLDIIAQRTVLQELHDIVNGIVLFEHIGYVYDIGMVELREVVSLLDKLLTVFLHLCGAAR